MASYNRVILCGRATRDVECKYLVSGVAVCELPLAVNRVWYDKTTREKREEVVYCDITLWGRCAETAGEYVKKGRGVLVEGRLSLDRWIDKAGIARSRLRVVGEAIQLLPTRGEEETAAETVSDIDLNEVEPETPF